MEHYNEKGWMGPMDRLPSSLRTYGEIFGNALGTNEANTLNTTDLPKNLSEIKTEWNSYDLLGNYAYEIKINDSPIRDLIKVGIKYGQIVEGGPHVWYYVFQRADNDTIKYIVSPWYVEKYNDLRDDPTMNYSQITKRCSEYAAQQLAVQQLAAQQQELADEDPVAGLEALLADIALLTESHAGPETLSEALPGDLKLQETRGSSHADAAALRARQRQLKNLSTAAYPSLLDKPDDMARHWATYQDELREREKAREKARAAKEHLIKEGHMTVTPGGGLGGSLGGGRKRRYTKKRKYTKKRRSSKKRRSRTRRRRR